MIELYCRHHLHQDTMPDEYQHLAEFACRHLDHCKYGEQKTACKDCPTHCYAPKEREQIREVMRWAGPRMIWYAPKDAILPYRMEGNVELPSGERENMFGFWKSRLTDLLSGDERLAYQKVVNR